MSNLIPGNQKHLNLDNRLFIEKSLNEGRSFKDIARYLCKDPTTISKEVKLHRLSDWYHKGTFYNAHNFCIHYEGYNNYRKLVTKIFDYINDSPEQLLITGSSAGGFGAAILADDAIELFNNPQDVTVHVDSSLLINENWHDVMVDEWNSPKAFSDVVTSDNITLDSLVALHNKRGNVKILFDCSIRDYNLSMAQRFFDEGSQKDMPLTIGKAEGDRFQQLLKKMVADMQEQIPGCGIYIWDEVTQKDGHLTVHTATGTKIYFDKRGKNPSIAEWLENAMNGNVESFGLELLDRDY